MTQLQGAALLAAAVLAMCGCATPQTGRGSDSSDSTGGSGGESGTPAVLAKAPSSDSSSSSAGGSAAPPSDSASSSTRAGGAAGASGSAVPPSAQTPDERRSAIDRRLNDSLGTFDSELKKEQERVAKERDERAAARAGTAGGEEGEDTEGTDSESGTAGTEGLPATGSEAETKDADGKRPGDLKSERQGQSGSASGSNSPNGAGSRQIPDGSDDDIVARRLRKAAEQETDPELKEKLWKEYIEYKKNTSK